VEQVPTRPRVSVPIPPPDDVTSEIDEGLSDKRESDSLDLASIGGAAPEKRCYVCGTNLAGRTRLKDHLGRYWCKECAAADERAKRREEELRCADCSRVFPARKLQYFQADRVCATCFKAREKALERKILKANLNKVEKENEFKQLKLLAIIAAVLILLGTIGFLISR
jgi:hypothetical protein